MNNTLEFSIVTNRLGVKTATVSIATLLSQSDYDAIWAGDNGNPGTETERVQEIRSLFETFILEGQWCDLQIWEEGNAFVNGVDPSKLHALLEAVAVFDNDTYELAECL